MFGFKKTLLSVGAVMVAAGGPVTLFTGSNIADSAKRSWFPTSAATATANPQQTHAAGSPATAIDGQHKTLAHASTDLGQASATNADLGPTPSLPEVLRFDVTVEWVIQRWPRVSTGLPYVQLQGYRVPLVTGTSVADLAGSLTYYFNAQQKVDRITLRGSTGNPSMLVSLLTSRYRFTRRLTNDPGLLFYEAVDSSHHPVGTLKIRSANVIKANQPYTRFDVDLVMDRAE